MLGDVVAVIGAGTVGSSWAALFLSHGLKVRAWDPAPDCGGISAFLAAAATERPLPVGDELAAALTVCATPEEVPDAQPPSDSHCLTTTCPYLRGVEHSVFIWWCWCWCWWWCCC